MDLTEGVAGVVGCGGVYPSIEIIEVGEDLEPELGGEGEEGHFLL